MSQQTSKIHIRLEKKADYTQVEQITFRAFDSAPPTGADDDGSEALLAQKLRSHASFVPKLDFVAEVDLRLVGNIMYSQGKIVTPNGEEIPALTFGPLSVLPAYQKKGVGQALVQHSLEAAKNLGYSAVLIFGHESYYPQFGFRPASEYGITTAEGLNFPAFMALELQPGSLFSIQGKFILPEVFYQLDAKEAQALNQKLAQPMDIDEYIEAQPSEVQPILAAIRKTIHTNAPQAIEKISWQMPTFWQGENLIHFAAFKKHIGLYAGGEATSAFADRLTAYKASKGAIQLPLNQPIDHQLIRDIVQWRLSQLA